MERRRTQQSQHLSKKVQDSEGCSSPYHTTTWSKEDWSFSTRNSPSARFAIWSVNTSRKRSLRQVCGLYALAMLVCTWVLCLAPQAFQSWEKASLFPETYTWDEPNHHELDGRGGPTADSECVCACKSAGEDVGSHHLQSFCAAVQASWNTSLESRHHCNVCSRCLLVPCPRSHRAWQAWIPLPAARAKIRPRRRMVPPRLPLQMFFSSRIVASSCFRRQPRVSLKRYSNRLQRLKLHTSPKQTSTWKSLSNTIKYNRAQGKGGPTFGPHLLREAAVNESSCLKELRQRLVRATRQGLVWYERNRHCSWVPCLAPHRGLEVCHKGTHRELHQTPCHSCLPNRTCRSRRSAHPCSSVIVSKRIMHPWEGTIRQQIASYVDHQRRTARLARGCTAYASQIAPCRSVMTQVRTVHACSYHPSCDPAEVWHPAEVFSHRLQHAPQVKTRSCKGSWLDPQRARLKVLMSVLQSVGRRLLPFVLGDCGRDVLCAAYRISGHESL